MFSNKLRVAVFDDPEYGRASQASLAYRDHLEDDFEVDLVDDLGYVMDNFEDYDFVGLHWSAVVWSSYDEEEVYREMDEGATTPFIFSGI